MNWFRGNAEDQDNNNSSNNNNPDQPSSTPDANELRRRRLAKLEAAQASEKARRKDLEERKAKWEAERQAAAAAAPPPPPKPAPPPPPAPEPVEPVPKRPAPALPSVAVQVSRAVARTLGIALDERAAGTDAVYDAPLIAQLRADAALTDDSAPLVLDTEAHADDVLLNRMNAGADPLAYLFSTFTRGVAQTAEIGNNRRIAGPEHEARRKAVREALVGLERRVLTYAGMVLSGAFMETDDVSSTAFAERLMSGKLPSGFLRALLARHTEEDGPGMDDLKPVFVGVFQAVRARAHTDMRLSSKDFLKPLEALQTLVSHKELASILTEQSSFAPEMNLKSKKSIVAFSSVSYLVPFFKISALPGLPFGQTPLFPEDPSIATSMFQNPSMMDRAEAEGAIYSLRSSLSVARSYLARICLSLCKAGREPRNATLAWFATVCNLNKKRAGMRPDPRVTSRDGFMLNVMFVLLKLCDPIVSGGWKMLQKIDPTYPQSSFRLNYDDETRLAADTDILKRWWVDQRNENAQESLTRHLETLSREHGLDSTAAASASADQTGEENPIEVTTDFNFVTECFWLALRAVQLGFLCVMNVYDEELLHLLQRLKEVIDDMERAKASGPLPPDQEMQLADYKRSFDNILQAKLCYDVYLHDVELLTMLVRFVTADAEWLMKKLLADPSRESILPLPLPVDRTFASLPEHTVETITTVLLTTMRTEQSVVQEHSALLEDMVSFCIVGSASPLHVRNPYLRAKLVEFLWTIFPRGSGPTEDDDDPPPAANQNMEALFAGHQLSRKFLPGSLFRLYVDVEHTGSHAQFYDKFSIRYRIGSILESVWYNPEYRKSVQNEARDETRFLTFVNMVLNDANHLLDSVLDYLEEIHQLETLINGGSDEWQGLSDEEKKEKQDRFEKLRDTVKSYNQLANNNVKLLWLLTSDEVVRRIFLRDEMVSRLAVMLNYLLVRLCGQRLRELVVSDPEKVSWKPRQLLSRILETYTNFHKEETFVSAVASDDRSYSADLFTRAVGIAKKWGIMSSENVRHLEGLAAGAEAALEAQNAAEEDLGDVPDEFLDPIMSHIMHNPVLLPTSGNIMDRSVISRILLSDKLDPFNRKLLTEDMLEDQVDLKKRIDAFIAEKRAARRAAAGSSSKDQ